VAFGGSGRLIGAGAFTIDLSTPAEACVADGGVARCLRVSAVAGGFIRLCDPELPAGNPQAC
jgi:type IV fimbrial biogenesis protein FimT